MFIPFYFNSISYLIPLTISMLKYYTNNIIIIDKQGVNLDPTDLILQILRYNM
jgi:hypothetical protein